MTTTDDSEEYRARRDQRDRDAAAERFVRSVALERDRFWSAMREKGIPLQPGWSIQHEQDFEAWRAQERADLARGLHEPAQNIGPEIVESKPHLSRYFHTNPSIGLTPRELDREVIEATTDMHRRLRAHVWEVEDQRARLAHARDARGRLN